VKLDQLLRLFWVDFPFAGKKVDLRNDIFDAFQSRIGFGLDLRVGCAETTCAFETPGFLKDTLALCRV
jgi:hypothetical protein